MRQELSLRNLHERHRALTVPLAGTYEEAASVCLQRHHTPPVDVILADNGSRSSASVNWVSLTSGLAMLGITRPMRPGTAPMGVSSLGLRCCAACTRCGAPRPEQGPTTTSDRRDRASTTLKSVFDWKSRVLTTATRRRFSGASGTKVRQARAGNSSLPAVAGIFGFSAKLLTVQDVPESS